MKVSESWLREWVNPDVDTETLCERVTLAGLEIEHRALVPKPPSGVLVGRIESVAPHPQADRLQVCAVITAPDGEARQIVCGAANARAGLVVPVALPGAELPSGMTIGEAELRGVPSAGMLCSEAELGLAEKSAGLMELEDGAPLGVDVVDYLGLDDTVLELELTPNRGDCLSVLGLARECHAVFDVPVAGVDEASVEASCEARIEVSIDEPAACTGYAGRVVRGLDAAARTPDWMVERLRRSGIRAIHPVVDITNYVMLELGQPMHAFDCRELSGSIRVRAAEAGESLELLNEQTVTLNDGELLIADAARPLALAGVMGGEGSGVSDGTENIFLESARFAPEAVALTGRRHKLNSDSLYRFERGVDPGLQRRALERATQLVLAICGGQAGPVVHAGQVEASRRRIALRHARLEQLLGVPVDAAGVPGLLGRLGIVAEAEGGGWNCTVPTARSDLQIEVDLVEEVARLIGYRRISAAPYAAALSPAPLPETRRDEHAVRDALVARGYSEIVSYSFVDEATQTLVGGDQPAIALDNPIAENLGVMRTTLLGGLLGAWRYNAQRQPRRATLFELGVCFARDGEAIRETPRVAGLLVGDLAEEQWGQSPRPADFYDLKADVEAVFGAALHFEPGEHPAMHPGRCARVRVDGQAVGWIGALHPRVARSLDLGGQVIVFELDLEPVTRRALPAHAAVSDRPASRRDLALVIPETTSAAALLAAVKAPAVAGLVDVRLFDVYRGEGLPDACKSVALGLIFQDKSRTLTDDEVDESVQRIVNHVTEALGASIRG